MSEDNHLANPGFFYQTFRDFLSPSMIERSHWIVEDKAGAVVHGGDFGQKRRQGHASLLAFTEHTRDFGVRPCQEPDLVLRRAKAASNTSDLNADSVRCQKCDLVNESIPELRGDYFVGKLVAQIGDGRRDKILQADFNQGNGEKPQVFGLDKGDGRCQMMAILQPFQLLLSASTLDGIDELIEFSCTGVEPFGEFLQRANRRGRRWSYFGWMT
jgi:hypothetical protein